ncbi:ATP-binding protein, partial [cf. Phormidesmis sp. LEGE 11477]|uniref:ATP-binding protein n=1 Tax=cf. Phormidesmis sp. LEGE 11477 TaxID=1828680 RepID=UPI001882DC9F
ENLAECREISQLKRVLKANDVEIFDNFSRYTQQFRKRFGLASEKALDLFNQTVSIKQIDGLNNFVRDHMLETVDMREKIDGLVGSYENLTISHNSIQKAREQLEVLMPLTKESAKLQKIERELSVLERSIAVTPAFFAAQKLTRLQTRLQQIQEDLARSTNQKDSCDRTLTTLRQQAKELEFAIQNDSVGQQLQALKQQIEQVQKEIDQKRHSAQQYDRLAKQLDLASHSNRDDFYAGREQGNALAQEIEAALAAITAQRDELKLTQARLKQERDQLEAELVSLRSRKSQIPKQNLDIRDRLLQSLNLADSDLPFTGELLQVRLEEKAWEGAIERLLRSFGLCLLVPEAHYRAVNAYVNKTDLRGRLVYYKVTATAPNPTQRSLDPSQIPGKVQVKQDDVFFEWLRSRLTQQFNYVCCDDIEQFQREKRAITKAGLIKHGQGRHEKDDSFRLNQRSRYILGWDNADKIKALEADLKAVTQQLAKIDKEIDGLEQARSHREQQRSWLQDFMRFADFAEIDWESGERDQQVLVKQKQKLEASSNKLKQLEAQLETTQSEIVKISVSRDLALQAIGTFESYQQDNLKAQTQCERLLKAAASDELSAFEKSHAKKLKTYELTLETIAEDESAMKDSLQAQLRSREQKRDTIKNEIVRCLIRFKEAYREETLEFGSSYEDLPDYLKLQQQIAKDDLPKHEKRFKQLMNEKVIIAISMFKSDLEKQEEEIELAIHDLNESLRQIAYTDATYIELCCAKTKHREIRDFKESLRSCLGDVARQSPEDQEERFQRIRTQLIERFKASDRWTKLVTDVRNWLDFSVSERYREDDVEKEHHTDSSGKSGGQKVKLAYTILASAIAYQFGLTQTDANGFNGAYPIEDRSFRFVVIDEAFSRSDDSNARYAMELFKNLNLQLLVITPKDKINVIESYIDTLHFVSNSPAGDYSKVMSVSIEAFQQKHRKSTALES